MTSREILKELSRPFSPDYHKWRIISTFPDRRNPARQRGIIAFYISARDVQNRLDKVLGPDRWRVDFEVVSSACVKCTLYVSFDGERWVGKSDLGTTTKDDLKGAASDAMKRAAVHFGIGRYLYSMRYLAEIEGGRVVNEEEIKKYLEDYINALQKRYE